MGTPPQIVNFDDPAAGPPQQVQFDEPLAQPQQPQEPLQGSWLHKAADFMKEHIKPEHGEFFDPLYKSDQDIPSIGDLTMAGAGVPEKAASAGAEAVGGGMAKDIASKIHGYLKDLMGFGEKETVAAAPKAAEAATEAAPAAETAAETPKPQTKRVRAGVEPTPEAVPQERVDTAKAHPVMKAAGKDSAEQAFLDHLGKSKDEIAEAKNVAQQTYAEHIAKLRKAGTAGGPRGGVTPEMQKAAKEASRAVYLKHLGLDEHAMEVAKSVARQGYIKTLRAGPTADILAKYATVKK